MLVSDAIKISREIRENSVLNLKKISIHLFLEGCINGIFINKLKLNTFKFTIDENLKFTTDNVIININDLNDLEIIETENSLLLYNALVQYNITKI